MHSKRALFITLFFLLVPQALSQSANPYPRFTLQVASFPDDASADRFIAKLKGDGEQPVWGTIELPGRGRWTRVYLGTFQTAEAARNYAGHLSSRGVIKEYLIKTSYEIELLSRPRTISRSNVPVAERNDAQKTPSTTLRSQPLRNNDGRGKSSPGQSIMVMNGYIETVPILLPVVKTRAVDLAPLGADAIPRPEPVRIAFRFIAGEPKSDFFGRNQRGGLWITGDTEEALERLRWIVGAENAEALVIDASGHVELDKDLVAGATGIGGSNSTEDTLRAIDYICSNEGLLLLVQLTQSQHRYRLHVSRQSPTFGEAIEVTGSINLDNNYDSRINPYRRSGKKLDKERPPEGFDSIVAINPIARWFNLREQAIVPVGHITFHELAEAHAKLELELDYLGQGSRPGAHNIALERERLLKAQRPLSDVIVTAGSNRVLRSEEEIRLFYSQNGISVTNQR
jgi:SPOR domain